MQTQHREIDEAATSHYARAGDIRLHYNEVGSGYPVIMLHGAGPGATSWSNFRRNVLPFSARYRALLVDMPQFGKSAKPVIEGGRQSYTARALRAFMDELSIPKAHFVGNSMGGQAAIKLAIDAPERVDRLVVIGSTPVSHSIFAPMPLEGIKLIAGYYKGTGPSMEKMRALLHTLVYDASIVTDEMVRERYESSIDPEIVAVNTNHPPAKEDFSNQLTKVACPTLLVWGLEDRFGALDIGMLMAKKFQDARMLLLGKCGHSAQMEHADEFNRHVLAFLQG
ncbi:MAG: alpha/beta fold hydrolase [Chloroflexi bacterium]|nr:alpha/beta fold hydrolase [Chloroflexota bacterium]